MATTTKTKAKPGVITRLPSSSGQYDPFNPGGTAFQQQDLPAYTPATRAASGASGTGGATGAAQGFGSPAGVPQAFADDIASDLNRNLAGGYKGNDGEVTPQPRPGSGPSTLLNYQGKQYPVKVEADGSVSQDEFNRIVQQAWSQTPADKKASYAQRDSEAIGAQNNAQLQGIAAQAATGGAAQNAATANRLWGNLVDPAVQNAIGTQAAQKTADRGVESDNARATQQFGMTLDQEEALRRAGIDSTNSQNSQISQGFLDETRAANARNVGFADQYTAAAAGANAEQTGAFNTLRDQNTATNALQTQQYGTFAGQMAGINANQTGLYNNFMGDISSANSQQNQNLSQFGGAVSSANSQQNQIVQQYSQQLASMNKVDQAAFLQYINETNPMMAQMIAQASNPEYVANQTNAIQQFKNNYDPEVTGQERFLAELARRKFEGDDKSSRDAQMQQLAGRGLKSGGLVIANQQATGQQLGQDRMLNELGLQAGAVQRAERNRVDYSNASDALRNADDSMRHFQDTYAQQDAIRRSNLSLNRNQQSLATTRQVTDRDSANYQARTQSNNLNYDRNRDYYDAGTQTVNNNFARTQAGYDAGSQTNRDNAGRDMNVFDAGRATNLDNAGRNQGTFDASTLTTDNNFARTGGAIGVQMGVNQTNLGNLSNATIGPGGQISTNNDNDARTQGGINSREIAAGSKRQAVNQDGTVITGNRNNETSQATNWVPVATGTAEAGSRIQRGITQERQDAIDRLLSQNTKKRADQAAGLG